MVERDAYDSYITRNDAFQKDTHLTEHDFDISAKKDMFPDIRREFLHEFHLRFPQEFLNIFGIFSMNHKVFPTQFFGVPPGVLLGFSNGFSSETSPIMFLGFSKISVFKFLLELRQVLQEFHQASELIHQGTYSGI